MKTENDWRPEVGKLAWTARIEGIEQVELGDRFFNYQNIPCFYIKYIRGMKVSSCYVEEEYLFQTPTAAFVALIENIIIYDLEGNIVE